MLVGFFQFSEVEEAITSTMEAKSVFVVVNSPSLDFVPGGSLHGCYVPSVFAGMLVCCARSDVSNHGVSLWNSLHAMVSSVCDSNTAR